MLFWLQIMYFLHVLLDYNLFEMNISYGFGNIKAINFNTIQTAFGAVDRNLKRYSQKLDFILHSGFTVCSV